ncbi:hypothetical protein B0T19DRAFT_405511 [Cercophora scortea]|uniref:RING-type E3 ubiquitin transferase n=1 Tax=Cercophora scortea TaxID=314031 RepID=A0AAE0M4S1_9PEZI|nr:hypothetical protein B0T19DRAFT_405511 [Cercophora scortea]
MASNHEASGADADFDANEIQAQVLQTILAEVSILRQHAGHNENDSNDDEVVGAAPDCCVICLDTISEPCTALPCSHAHFDFLCLLSWLQQRPSCPLCQSAVYKVNYTDTKAGDSVYRVPNAPRTRKEDESREPAAVRTSWRGEAAPTGLGFRPRNSNHYRRRGPEVVTPSPDEAIQRRRNIYRHKLYSLHVGSNRHSQYKQPPTPDEFAATPHLVSRARLWIRRELQVFAFLASPTTPSSSTSTSHAQNQEQTRRRNNAEFLLEYIIAILKTVDMQGSAGQAEDMLSDFLGREHARLFLHELRSWLRSPSQTLAAWDREVQYPDPEVVCQAQRKRSLGEYERESESSTARREPERIPWRRDDGGGGGRKRRHRELGGSEESDWRRDGDAGGSPVFQLKSEIHASATDRSGGHLPDQRVNPVGMPRPGSIGSGDGKIMNAQSESSSKSASYDEMQTAESCFGDFETKQ